MRRKGIFALAFLLFIAAVIAYFFRDRYLERGLEKAMETVVGARVEIDNFHLSMLKLSCSWDSLQIADPADPWKNLLQSGRAVLDFEVRPLWWRRVNVRELRLEGVRTGVRRSRDGSLPGAEHETEGLAGRVAKRVKQQLRNLPALDFSALRRKFNVDSLVASQQLQSVASLLELRSAADSAYSSLLPKVRDSRVPDRLQALEKRIGALKIQKPKTVAELTAQLKEAEAVGSEIQKLKQEVGQTVDAVQSAAGRFDAGLADLPEKVRADIRRAQSLAGIGEFRVRDVGLMLLGEPVAEKLAGVTRWVEIFRKYAPTAQALVSSSQPSKPVRSEGREVRFPFRYRYPHFLVQKAVLSGATGSVASGLALSGEVIGLTDEPGVWGQPTQLRLTAEKPDGNRYRLFAVFDHVGEVPRDTLRLQADRFAVGKLELGRRAFLPTALAAEKGTLSLQGVFIGSHIDLKMAFQASPVEFRFENGAAGEVARMVRDVLRGVRRLQVSARLKDEGDGPVLALQTNLDEDLGRRLKQVVDARLADARREIRRRIETKVQEAQVASLAAVTKFRDEVVGPVQKWQEKLQQYEREIEAKKQEIARQIDAEKQKIARRAAEEKRKLEQKAKSKLKGLLKKKN